MSINQKFRKAVCLPFNNLTVEDLKPIALGFWHEKYIPNLDNLDRDELLKAGYLIVRFRGYNCIAKEHKKELANLVKQIEQVISDTEQAIEEVDNLEPLARKWYLREDISHLMSSLLKYQTRHYNHV